ncbi:arsinothricin resistance N-acetyltransferase ArsN1 family A [Mesobacillus selenatarsenatis]|uniref:Phosphinothricin N-acetyltransferase n=1 Tax=Mesobacillus selenatarsenatis (strain DSM 18680 / JCM 14380 / FERM P-15431 / SF-1) TaxID=1321606 RepID=A0A0A8X2C7_MESS1|nr:arsinothricin resistance N-acetyltransferase ArsN1 family A [Mesobacillus selenatarsenatis]GAM12281.1 phosphinothricin N-acetyltransferase [Mesobacillus selenatarsenatis SF-1]
MNETIIRVAAQEDADDILTIYNEGISDRIATLETTTKNLDYMRDWLNKHTDRYKVIVAELDGKVIGWASLNQYNNRDAYKGVADLSVYIKREYRGKGIGGKLLTFIESMAKENGFHKIVLFTFAFNELGQGLYRKKGYREVGVFQNQGMLDGKFVDVMAMEKLLY